jgi:transcriptional regulator with XRE-family HTH domain
MNTTVTEHAIAVGSMLRQWRAARNMTQLELALEAEVSTRHLSFIENGRSNPSREMLLILGSVLEIPLRERNALLVSAGFAPAYRETNLEAPEMAPVRTVVDFMLEQAQPYGAVVVDGSWNLLRANAPATLFTHTFVLDPPAVLMDGPPNLLRLLLHPAGVRQRCLNWQALARAMVGRVHRELAMAHDRALAAVLDQVLAYEGVPADWRVLDVQEPSSLLLPMHMRTERQELQFFTTITSLGTAQDITLQELRIESFFPADPESDRIWKDLVKS